MLELKNVGKSYGDNVILKDTNFDVNQGEIISILGPSGCGKTTRALTSSRTGVARYGRLSGSEPEIRAWSSLVSSSKMSRASSMESTPTKRFS